MRNLFCFVLTALLFLFARGSFAQTTGGIHGTVQLPNGDPAAGAVVILTNSTTNAVVASTLVSINGTFAFTNIPQGNYKITVALVGYELFTSGNYLILPGIDSYVLICLVEAEDLREPWIYELFETYLNLKPI